MAEKKTLSWQIPKYGSSLLEVAEWCRRQKDDAVEALSAEPGFQQLDESVRILSGYPDEKLAAKQRDFRYSKVQINRLKRNLREMVNSLSEIRYLNGYSSNNTKEYDQSEIFNKYSQFWYFDQFVDLKIKKGIQWMAISPRAWLEIAYRRMFGERGRTEVDVIAHSFADVVFTGVPESGDYQEAYTGTIIKDLPPHIAHALWPDHQSMLVPDRELPRGFFERVRDKAKEVINDVFQNTPDDKTGAKQPTVRLYYQYILDLSINRSKTEMKMGYEKRKNPVTGLEEDFETPWSYKVPFLGQMIPAGYDDKGIQVYRAATKEDARIFPGRRLVVFNDRPQDPAIHDGPMWDLHGKIPVVKLAADSWPFADYSMVHDVACEQDTVDELSRIQHQTIRNRYNPSIKYNMRAVPRETAKTIRTDVTGQRIGYNGSEGTGANVVESLLPKEFYTIDAALPDMIKFLIEQMDYQMGVRDVSALSKMKAGSSPDSLEKMLELAGPIVKGISRDMERAMRDLADMFKFMVLQYVRTPQLLQVLGADQITPENYDYQPGNLIPSHLPGENKNFPSIFSEQQRIRWAANHTKFIILPGTMHQIVQTSQKLLFLQLWKMGFPIDPWTLSEVLTLGNFGKTPDGSNSIMDRWIAWQKKQIEIKAELSSMMQQLSPDSSESGETPNASKLGPGGGQIGKGGRPSKDETMPKLQAKSDGRPVMRTTQ